MNDTEKLINLLKLGLDDGFKRLKTPRSIPVVGPINYENAMDMLKKFASEKFDDGSLISNSYMMKEEVQEELVKSLSIPKINTLTLHLIIVSKDFHQDLNRKDVHLQFAFEVNNKKEYYIGLNTDKLIKLSGDKFQEFQDKFEISNLSKSLDKYIFNNTKGIHSKNTRKIIIDDIESGKNIVLGELGKKNSKAIFMHPAIQTLALNKLEDLDEKNILQLFSFGLISSLIELKNEETAITFGPPVDDKYRNCPPLC